MSAKVAGYIRQHHLGLVAIFLALSGTAYAANTVGSADIINESILSQDVKNGEVKIADIGQGAVATDEIANNQVRTSDIGDGQVTTGDVNNDNLTGGDIAPNSLKGADVDEGSLAGALIPGIATSGLVKSSGAVTVDDPVGGGATARTLLKAGPFTITGFCTDHDDGFNSDVAEAYVSSSGGNWAMTSAAEGGAPESFFLDTDTSARLVQIFGVDGIDATAGDYTAQVSNRFLAGEVFAGLNISSFPSDCVFGVTGIG
jgi:hypothetical protein